MGFSFKRALKGAGAGSMLGPWGAILGSVIGGSSGGGPQPTPTVRKARPEGMANYYDDSWKILLEGSQQDRSIEDSLQAILQGFKGDPKHLEQFLRQAVPFLAASEVGRLRKTEGFKHMQDQSNWDLGAMAGYGQAAANMGRQTEHGVQKGMNQLGAAGLGRSSMRGALQQQALGNLGAQQGNLWSQTYQQAQRNRMSSATNAMDAHRMISQLALGQKITPRMQQPQDDGLASAAGIAGGIGGLLQGAGALFGG